MTRLFPADRVRHFPTDTRLLRQHDTTAVSPQPSHGQCHKLCVSHRESLEAGERCEKCRISYSLVSAGEEQPTVDLKEVSTNAPGSASAGPFPAGAGRQQHFRPTAPVENIRPPGRRSH